MTNKQIEQLGRIIKNLRKTNDDREVELFRRKAEIAKEYGVDTELI